MKITLEIKEVYDTLNSCSYIWSIKYNEVTLVSGISDSLVECAKNGAEELQEYASRF